MARQPGKLNPKVEAAIEAAQASVAEQIRKLDPDVVLELTLSKRQPRRPGGRMSDEEPPIFRDSFRDNGDDFFRDIFHDQPPPERLKAQQRLR